LRDTASLAAPGHLDEVFLTLRGGSYLLRRAMDEQHTQSEILAKDEILESGELEARIHQGDSKTEHRENSHQPTRRRARRMRGFSDPRRTQTFLSTF
jgi:putative transposase